MPDAKNVDQTEDIQKLIDAGSVDLLPGTYAVSGLRLPSRGKSIRLAGAGPDLTILKASKPQSPIFIGGDEISESSVVAGVGLMAHDEGNAAAVQLDSHLGTRWADIAIVENANGGKFEVGFLLSGRRACYANTLEQIRVTRMNNAPGVVIQCKSATGDYKGNPNANTIRNIICYALRGTNVVLDLAESTLATVQGGLIESVPEAVAIIPGNLTAIRDLWIEQVGEIVRTKAVTTISPNNVTFEHVYFSGAGNIVIGPYVKGWRILGCGGGASLNLQFAATNPTGPGSVETQ